MDWLDISKHILMVVYTFCLVMVCVYGFHRYLIVFLYYRHRSKAPKPAGTFKELPIVTVQLPMYNEQYVAQRIIEATCKIRWPKDRLQIQVLDDSTDDTVQIAADAVAKARTEGFDIEYVHRNDRSGYKAGALENGLKTAKGAFCTIFDADFIPDPDILYKCIDYFTDPKVCAVQTRWEHINRNDSWLTKTQAIFLDGHFAIEHVARNRSGRFMAFNGTAGTWRIASIRDSGGWQHDTLTEDMDLSFRAQLRGWKFIFVPHVTAPAELPPEMNAFKAQQFRWTKGGAQTAIKMLPKILASKAPLKAKIEATFQLTCFSVHLYVLVLVALLFPAMMIRDLPMMQYGTPARAIFDVLVFALATMSATVFYVASQYELFRDWRTVLKYMPFLMALGIGVSLSNTKAVLEALLGKQSEFVRTPKFAVGSSRSAEATLQATTVKKRKRRILPYIEFAFGLYMSVCAVMSMMSVKSLLTAPFLILFAFGFFYVSILTFAGQRVAKPVKSVELVAEEA